MTLGKWHHRRGGQWKVEYSHTYFCFGWEALMVDSDGKSNPLTMKRGRSHYAWLARRRAIAALKTMSKPDSN